MATYVSGLTAGPPTASGSAINKANRATATVPVSGYANGVMVSGATAPYIGVAVLPPAPTTGQLWPPLN